MILSIECMYCGHCWEHELHTSKNTPELQCIKCNDMNLKVKDKNNSKKVDYYQGCPPFPLKDDLLDYEDDIFDPYF